MKVIIKDTYEAISKQTADDLLEVMSMYETPLLSPASGSSPLGLYKELVERYQQKKFDHSNLELLITEQGYINFRFPTNYYQDFL